MHLITPVGGRGQLPPGLKPENEGVERASPKRRLPIDRDSSFDFEKLRHMTHKPQLLTRLGEDRRLVFMLLDRSAAVSHHHHHLPLHTHSLSLQSISCYSPSCISFK